MSDVARFLDGLRRREDAYHRMLQASGEKAGALASGDVDALLRLAGHQRALLEEIEDIEKGLAPDRGRWPELKASLDPETVREVEETVDRTRRALETLVRMEDEGNPRAAGEGVPPGPLVQRRAQGAYGADRRGGA
jgi:hypothetical protein